MHERENPTVDNQITRIAAKLDQLRNRDTAYDVFAASSHRYQLCPPLPEDEAAAWERQHGVTLPKGFRDFLTQLGNGGAGPDYGLYPLDRATKEAASFKNDLPELFPLTAADADHIRRMRWEERERYFMVDVPLGAPGALPIHHAGCHHYHFLILTGELRGTVWYGSDGWCPLMNEEGRPLSFLDWYEHWLDSYLAPGGLPDADAVLDRPEEVTGLNLASRKLTAVPDAVSRMSRLEKLLLNGNEIAELPDWMGGLKNLITLNLGLNKLTQLPRSMGRCERLETVWLGLNPLTHLPESIGWWRNLRSLAVSHAALEMLPEALGRLTALEELSIGANKLPELPDSVGELVALSEVNLSRNQIARLPESFGRLVELRVLNLSQNRLGALPDSFAALAKLWNLDLGGNAFSRLPAVVVRLPRLRVLRVGLMPDLDVADACRQLAEAPALEELSLCGNKWGALPPEVGRLRVRSLKVAWNRLTDLPTSLVEATELEELDLSHNAFTRAPEVLRHMTHLKKLLLANNPLVKSKEEMHRLRGWLPGTQCWFF